MTILQARITALAAMLCCHAPVIGQQSASAPGSGTVVADDPCTTAVPTDMVAMAPFLDRILIPGKPFDLSGISPSTMATMGAAMAAAKKQQSRDWPNLCRYRQENAAVRASGRRPDTIFLGDSITEFWKLADPAMFGAGVLDRGISGQTTPQILLRFQADVAALRPRIVHILAGTNDIAGATGPASDDMIIDNIRAMLDLAAANGVRVVLASITPVASDSKERPLARILALNGRLRALAAERHAIYLDYFAALDDGRQALDTRLANDGLHPNRNGYAVMRPLAKAAIARAAR